jgi:hypothetical protein
VEPVKVGPVEPVEPGRKEEPMSFVWAGLLAAAGAWVLNRLVVRLYGETAIFKLIPWLEETLKTGSALLTGADLVLTHSVFGLAEALHDYLVSPRWGLAAGLVGVISHWFYGWVTGVLYGYTGSWLVSVFLTGAIHMGWNYLMVRLFSFFSVGPRRKGK